jgi:hypothetical protein
MSLKGSRIRTLMRIQIQLFTSVRIRILLLIKVSESVTSSLQTLQGSCLRLHASIVSLHGPPRLNFEHLKVFYFNADRDPDLDPAVHSNTDPDP